MYNEHSHGVGSRSCRQATLNGLLLPGATPLHKVVFLCAVFFAFCMWARTGAKTSFWYFSTLIVAIGCFEPSPNKAMIGDVASAF